MPEDEESDPVERDERGLQVGDEAKSESQARLSYFRLLGMCFVIGQVLAWAAYFAIRALWPYQKNLMDQKFSFLHEQQLGWLYVIWFVLFYTRLYLMVNTNGARAEARVDRPDQHVYKVMAQAGEFSKPNAPYVMMVNTGPVGRFNRAQRAAYNMDESLALYGLALWLAGYVFGPLVAFIVLVYGMGRVHFANSYKKAASARGTGFLLSMVGEQLVYGLAILCGFKAMVGPAVKF